MAKKSVFVIVMLLLGFIAFSQVKKNRPLVVTGVVLDDKTDKPVSNAHVYVVYGEEEAMTNSKGEFRIESWQALPLKVKVDQAEYQKAAVQVSGNGQPAVVRLKSKNNN